MKRNQKFYRKNESDVMKSLGFRPTKNSGSGWIEKEDGISEHCVCQLKSTDKDSICVKKHDLEVLKYNAIVSHKIPVLAIQFLESDDIWIMVKPEDVQYIQGILSEKYEKYVETKDLCVDTEIEVCYDDGVQRDNIKSVKGRKRNMKLSENERERKGEEYKRRIKEKRR